MNKDIQLDKYSIKPSLTSKIITKPFKPENTIQQNDICDFDNFDIDELDREMKEKYGGGKNVQQKYSEESSDDSLKLDLGFPLHNNDSDNDECSKNLLNANKYSKQAFLEDSDCSDDPPLNDMKPKNKKDNQNQTIKTTTLISGSDKFNLQRQPQDSIYSTKESSVDQFKNSKNINKADLSITNKYITQIKSSDLNFSQNDDDFNEDFQNSTFLRDQQLNQNVFEVVNSQKKEIIDILSLIDKNEKLNEAIPEDVIKQASQLLSFDNNFYGINDQIIMYQEFPLISKIILSNKQGNANCVQIFENSFFIGNSIGQIRIFDIKSQQEKFAALENSYVQNVSVTAMNVNYEFKLLVSAYGDGSICIWDLEDYKFLKHIPNLHESDITSVKIFFVQNNKQQISIASCEDKGCVRITHLTKKSFFGGFNINSEYLFKKKMEGCTQIAIYNQSNHQPQNYYSNQQLVAFGGRNMINICSLKPISCLLTIEPPKFCNAKSLPYVNWGFGLTPSNRQQSLPLFAFAWDKIIQLIYINDELSTFEMDGFYYSEVMEIISIFFIGESILYAVFQGKDCIQGKILYTTKFYPGSYKILEEEYKVQGNFRKNVENVIQIAVHSELENTFNKDLNKNFLDFNDVRGRQLKNFDSINYSNSVIQCEKAIIFLGKKIKIGMTSSWKQYLEKKRQSGSDWLRVLKIATEIFNGDLKGYSGLPDSKETREEVLKPFMKELIRGSIQNQIFNFKQRNNQRGKSLKDNTLDDYKPENIIIQVAIEFCKNINATDFLFNEIFQMFQQQNLSSNFIVNLEPFLISGYFKKEKLPQLILKNIIDYYRNKIDDHISLKNFERVIQQIDLNDDSDIKTKLEILCKEKHLVSAQISLNNNQNQMIDTLFAYMLKASQKMKKKIKQTQEETLKNQILFEKQDILRLKEMDQSMKYEFEKSYCYIGYKLLWVMKLFLEGRQVPYGSLSIDKWEQQTLIIANQVMKEEFLKEFLQFDPVCFFNVVIKLFTHEPFQFLVDENNKNRSFQMKSPEQILVQFKRVISIIAKSQEEKLYLSQIEMQNTLKSKDATTNQNQDFDQSNQIQNIFQEFLLKTFLDHQKYYEKQMKEKSKQKNKNAINNIKKLQIEQQQLLDSMKGVLYNYQKYSKTNGIISINESLDIFLSDIYQELKCSETQTQEIMKLIEDLKMNQQFLHLRIRILEAQGNFNQSFSLQIDNQEFKKHIFEWIISQFNKLERSNDDEKLDSFKNTVAHRMREMIDIDPDQTMKLIEDYFDDIYAERLILFELKDHLKERFKFLKKYIEINEINISLTIEKAMSQHEENENASKYLSFLNIYLELMCKLYAIKNDQKSTQFSQNKISPYQVQQKTDDLQYLNEISEKNIEAFVNKKYLHIKIPLEICTKYQQERAVGALQARDQKYLEAIQTYVNYLSKKSLVMIGQNLVLLMKDVISQKNLQWKNLLDLNRGSQIQTLEYIIREFSQKWDFENCFLYGFLQEYDDVIKSIIDIIPKIPVNILDQALYKLLDSLNEQAKEVGNNLIIEKQSDQIRFENIFKSYKIPINFECTVKLVESFIEKRKNCILQHHIPWQISPQELIQNLNLDLRSVKTLFDFKIRGFKSESKLRGIANQIIINETIQNSQNGLYKLSKGLKFNEEKFLNIQNKRVKRQIIEENNCEICKNSLTSCVQQGIIKSYLDCCHQFHLHCLNSFIKEEQNNNFDTLTSCPQCSLNLPVIQANQRRETAFKMKEVPDSIQTNKLNEFQDIQQPLYASSSLKRNDFLQSQQLEQFDIILNQSSLSLKDFGM